MKVAQVGCFVKAAESVLSSELAVPVTSELLSVTADPYRSKGVTAIVGLTGQIQGMVIFGLEEATALKMVSSMMGCDFSDMDDVAQSGIAELGNVVTGSSVTNLAAQGFKCGITPPAVILGYDARISTISIPRSVVTLSTQFGPVEMHLALRENGLH